MAQVVFGQNTVAVPDSTQLESYRFENDYSVREYWDLYTELQNELSREGQIKYGSKGAEAARKWGNDAFYVKFYLEVIRVYAVQLYDIDRTRELLELIREKIEQLNSDIYNAEYYNFKGVCYYLEGEYNEALEYYLKSYENSKNAHPQRAKGTLYNISKIYNRLRDYNNSIKFAREALTLNEKLPEREATFNTGLSNHLISLSYEKAGHLDTAFQHTERAIIALNKLDSLRGYNELQVYCEVNLDVLHYHLENNNLSKLDSVLQDLKRCSGKVEPLYSIALANYYLTVKNYDEAGKIIRDTSYRRNNHTANHYQLYLESRYQEGIGNYQEALAAERAYTQILEELTEDEILEYTAFADARFDAVKNREEIKRLKLISETESLKSKALLLAFLLSLGILTAGVLAFRKLKQQKVIIEKQAEELKKIDSLKSKLFSNISHELRTPLTLISEPIKALLAKGNLDESTDRQLRLAGKSSRQLLALSDQIMDLTKSEIGQVKVNPVGFYWNDFLDNISPEAKAKAEARGLKFVEERYFEGKIYLQSDLHKLIVVLNNLIQNALKYNKEGGSVCLRSYDRGEDLEFSIEDTGKGIDAKDLPRVFERYYQSAKNTEAEGGFGIGLAVCREYIRLLGGTISAESKLGEGTQIKVCLPKKRKEYGELSHHTFTTTALDAQPIFELVKQNPKGEFPDLLIVEDNADIREFLKTVLEENYNLSYASNGSEAFNKIEQIKPDLIITDWMMPIMNGFTFVEKLKSDAELRKIPVLMLTARSLPTDQLKAFRVGVNDYLLKPFEVDFLKQRIEYLIQRTESNISFLSSEERDAGEEKLIDVKHTEWLSNLEEIIFVQIKDFDLVAEKIAVEVSLSTTQLNRKVKTLTGYTTMQFVDEIRFWEARRLLEEQEVFSVKAVSYSVGFKSVKNFSRNFKKRFGKSPSSFLST